MASTTSDVAVRRASSNAMEPSKDTEPHAESSVGEGSPSEEALVEGDPTLVESLAEQLRLQLLDVAHGGTGRNELKETLEGQLRRVEEERDKLDQLREDLGKIAPGEYAAYRKERESREQLVTALSAAIEAAAHERERRMLAAEIARRRREQLDGLLQSHRKQTHRKDQTMRGAALVLLATAVLVTSNKVLRANPSVRRRIGRSLQGGWKNLLGCLKILRRKTVAFLLGPQPTSEPPRRRRRHTVSEENFEQWFDADARGDGNRQDARSLSRSPQSCRGQQSRTSLEEARQERALNTKAGPTGSFERPLEGHNFSPAPPNATPRRKNRSATPEPRSTPRDMAEGRAASIRRHSLDDFESGYMQPTASTDSDESLEKEPLNKMPHAFYCPITREVMKDPVIAADGYSYERDAIKLWLERHETSPITNLPLRHFHLVTNHSLRSAIHDLNG